jgi:hypothetical protein
MGNNVEGNHTIMTATTGNLLATPGRIVDFNIPVQIPPIRRSFSKKSKFDASKLLLS